MKPPSPATVRNMALRAPARFFATLALAAGFSIPASAAGSFFCCTDTNGKQICGDILPRECIGKAYRELGRGGQTLRKVEAPLTPEQRAQRAAEEEKHRLEEEKRKEQQRKDQALLNTYGNEREIEAMRKRAENDVYQSMKNAATKISEMRLTHKKLENEAEFYKKKTVPGDIQRGLRDTEFEIKAQESIIAAKKKELEVIRAKYDDDLRRFRELNQRPATPR